MKERLTATLTGVGSMATLVPSETTHCITLFADRQRMWELFWAIAAELQQNHTFHSRDPKAADMSVDLYIEVAHGLD